MKVVDAAAGLRPWFFVVSFTVMLVPDTEVVRLETIMSGSFVGSCCVVMVTGELVPCTPWLSVTVRTAM